MSEIGLDFLQAFRMGTPSLLLRHVPGLGKLLSD